MTEARPLHSGTGLFTFGWDAKLRKADDFSSVFRFCRRQRPSTTKAFTAKAACLEILTLPNNMGRARLGLVVGKRILKLAVARNRTRRVIREAFRHRQHELNGLDVVVRLTELPQMDQLGRECESLLNKVIAHWKAEPQPEVAQPA